MEIKFKADIKTIRKAFALVDLDIPSDEVIEATFRNGVIDISEDQAPDMQQAYLGFIMLAIGMLFDK